MDELDQMDQEIETLAAMQRQNPRSAPPLPAEFSIEAVLDEAASKPGAPVYKDKERIKVRVGTRDVKIRDVTEDDKRTYAAQYVAWKKSNHVDNTVEGFPLAQWAMIPGKAVVQQFAHYGIKTVQQLAALKDTDVSAIGPYMTLRQHARDWVASQEKTAPIAQLRAENDDLRARVKSLEELLAAHRERGGVVAAPAANPEIETLKATVAALVASMRAPEPVNGEPKRRGRPPKAKPPETTEQ